MKKSDKYRLYVVEQVKLAQKAARARGDKRRIRTMISSALSDIIMPDSMKSTVKKPTTLCYLFGSEAEVVKCDQIKMVTFPA